MCEVQKIAKSFQDILKDWLTADDFEAMKLWNGQNRENLCCASHDYCDANMAMIEALVRQGKMKSQDDDALIHTELMNAAWTHARQEGLI